MEYMHQIINVLKTLPQRDVLATIVDVNGSAYLKEGTSMLYREDGTRVGLLSAGCLEEDLSERVLNVFDEGLSQTITYDMRAEDDLSWGQGAGCNGVLQILLEPVDHFLRSHLNTLGKHLESGKTVVSAKKLTNDLNVSDYVFITDSHIFGKWQGDFPHKVKGLLESQNGKVKSGIVYMEELSSYVYLHLFKPKPRLIIFGAGPDAIPLVEIAARAGFSVLISDWRPALCNKGNFSKANEMIIDFPKTAIKQISLRHDDYVIILTHNFQRDQELLQLLANERLSYLGVLGSKARTQRLLKNVDKFGDIHSPVGLPIGAVGPEEIAVSIVADLIRVKRLQNSIVQPAV